METRSPTPLRLLSLSALTTGLFVSTLVWTAAALLLAVAVTTAGRLTALAFVLAVPALAAVPFARGARRREQTLAILVVLLAFGGLCGGWALHCAPAARSEPGPGLRSVYLGEAAHPRASLANLAPEVDQFTFGSYPFEFTALGRSLAPHGTPMLVVTGDAERRIPVRYTVECVALLRHGHDRLQLEVFPGEDHFLLFSQPDAVMDLLGAWIEAEVVAARE